MTVKLTLTDALTRNSIRMEMNGDERIREIVDIVREYWGQQDIILVEGYRVLDVSKTVSESVSDGDELVAIPDIGEITT